MPQLSNLLQGYGPSVTALVLATAYFALVALVVHRPGPAHVSVPRYQPPVGVSPAAAAWLLERNLARAVAAALVNIAAKGFIRIAHSEDLCTITQLRSEFTTALEPEEDALSYRLFRSYDVFDFDELNPRLIRAVKAFQTALLDTRYFSRNVGWSVPGWVISAVGVVMALANTQFWSRLNGDRAKLTILTAVLTFVCFLLAVRTLRDTFEKLATRLPGSIAPRRPWTGADGGALKYLFLSLLGINIFGYLSSPIAALIIFGFLLMNGIFFHALQGLTALGRQALTEIRDYRKFLAEVDADTISRLHVAERVPAQFGAEDAYAIALHLDWAGASSS